LFPYYFFPSISHILQMLQTYQKVIIQLTSLFPQGKFSINFGGLIILIVKIKNISVMISLVC